MSQKKRKNKGNTDLVSRAKKGESEAISALYQENIREIYRFIYYKVGNREDAEDLTQEVLMAAFHGLKKFREESTFRNWCYEIAKRKIADLWREKYKMPTVKIESVLGLHTVDKSKEDVKDEKIHDAMKVEQVKTVLGELKDNYREVLEYRFLKNYSIKETAKAMDLSVSNAKVLQHRALKKAAELGEGLFPET